MDYQTFVDTKKSLLIAPAGYGKTFTIVKAIQHTEGKQLILTHTHAGIASIREKLKQNEVENKRYNIETISSFAQKFVHSFYIGDDIPEQDSKEYHSFVIDKAINILSKPTIKNILCKSYAGLFVDEYQDCTQMQHNFIMLLSSVLPTRILGDPLQGIFDFNGQMVDFDKDLLEFTRFPDLPIPHRWYKDGNNKVLGDKLLEMREALSNGSKITLSAEKDKQFHVIKVQEGDILKSDSLYRKVLNHIITNKNNNADLESLLIIVPEYEETNKHGIKINKGDITHRAMLRSQIDYSKSLVLLEAIDDKSFYSLSKESDELLVSIKRARKKINKIRSFLRRIFNSTEIAAWFNNDGLKGKRNPNDQIKSKIVNQSMDDFFDKPSCNTLLSLIFTTKKQFSLKYRRDEVFRSLVLALKNAHAEKVSVFEAMKNSRNHIRRSGRKIHGKCIGTTLLTKGLEFDTVVILDAHRFDCRKHLYVALTRCCKCLIIFTANLELSPYSSNNIANGN